MVSVGPREYVAFDLETTGLDPEVDEILEVALVRFRDGEPGEEWSCLVKPSRKAPLYVLRLTGICEDDLAQAPRVQDILERIRDFMGDLPLVGHNSSFDWAFLEKTAAGISPRPCHDTLELSRIVIPGLASYRLSALCERLGIPLAAAHRALDDARASGILFDFLRNKAQDLGRNVSTFIVKVMGDTWVSKGLFVYPDSRGQDEAEGKAAGGVNPPPEVRVSGPVDRKPAGSFPGEGILARRQNSPTLFSGPNVERTLWSALANERMTETGSEPGIPLEVWSKAILVEAPETTRAFAGILAAAVRASSATKGTVAVACLDDRTVSKLEMALDASAGVFGDLVSVGESPRHRICLARWRAVETLVLDGAMVELDADSRRFLAMVANWLSATKTGSRREIYRFPNAEKTFAEIQASWYPECEKGCAYFQECVCSRQPWPPRQGVFVTYLEDLCSGGLPTNLVFAAVIIPGLHRMLDWCDRRADVFEPRQVGEFLGPAQGEVFFELDRWLADMLSTRRNDIWLPGKTEMPARLRKLLEEARDVLTRYVERRSVEDDEMKARLSVGGMPGHLPFLGRDISIAERFASVLGSMLSEQRDKVLIGDERYRDGSPVPVMKRVWICPGREVAEDLGSRTGKVILVSPLAQMLAGKRGFGRLLAVSENARLITTGCYEEPADVLTIFVDGLPRATDKSFEEKFASFAVETARALRDGCLVLTPSSFAAEALRKAMAPPLEAEGILVVSAEGSGQVAEYLGQPGTVVLSRFFAFGEDDFSGARCVIIPRLPFGVPRPEDGIREAEVRKAGGDYFRDVTLTGVLAKLNQVVDVLRNETGKRVLVVGDSRARPAGSGYGADVFEVLTPGEHVVCPPLVAVNRAKSWLSAGSKETVL